MIRTIAYGATVFWGLLTWHLTTTPNLVIADENLLNSIMMMGGHFTFFGVQAVLFHLSITPQYSRVIAIYSVALASLYGLVIELVQLRVPGRSADPMDWVLDTLGAVFFLYMFRKLSTRI